MLIFLLMLVFVLVLMLMLVLIPVKISLKPSIRHATKIDFMDVLFPSFLIVRNRMNITDKL